MDPIPNSPKDYSASFAKSKRVADILEIIPFALTAIQNIDIKTASNYVALPEIIENELGRCSTYLNDASVQNRGNLLNRAYKKKLHELYAKLKVAPCVGRTEIDSLSCKVVYRENSKDIRFFLMSDPYSLAGCQQISLQLRSENGLKIRKIRSTSYQATSQLIQVAIESMILSNSQCLLFVYKGARRPYRDNWLRQKGFFVRRTPFCNVAQIQMEDLKKKNVSVWKKDRSSKKMVSWHSIVTCSPILFPISPVDSLLSIALRKVVDLQKSMPAIDFFRMMKTKVPEEILVSLMAEKYTREIE